MPIRIQRKRTKGWKKPEGVVDVTRNSGWGNPYLIGKDGDREKVLALYEEHIAKGLHNHIVKELKGKDLMCWCKLSDSCHADILLRYANDIPYEKAT